MGSRHTVGMRAPRALVVGAFMLIAIASDGALGTPLTSIGITGARDVALVQSQPKIDQPFKTKHPNATKAGHSTTDNEAVTSAQHARARGGISIKYLPWMIIGVLLAVPILTVSVLKGCWMLVDYFCPPVQAYTPMNYAQMKLREEQGLSADETS